MFPIPARAGTAAALVGLVLSLWLSPLVCAIVAVSILYMLLVATR